MEGEEDGGGERWDSEDWIEEWICSGSVAVGLYGILALSWPEGAVNLVWIWDGNSFS